MKELGLSNKKHTTDDMMFTVETVSCLGACGLAPTCMVNEEVHAKMTPEKVVELINRLRGENGLGLTVKKSCKAKKLRSNRISRASHAVFLSVPVPDVWLPVLRKSMMRW